MRREGNFNKTLEDTKASAGTAKELAGQMSAFIQSEAGKRLAKDLGTQIDVLNQAYWEAGRKGDGVECAYLTGKREGLTFLTATIIGVLSESEAAQNDLQQWESYAQSLTNGYHG